MYTWAVHRRLSNEAVHNPDSPSPKSPPKPAGKSRGGDVSLNLSFLYPSCK